MSERQAFRDTILNAEDVQRLLKRLTLVERFHAVMATCEMPRVTNVLVEILRTELSERRGTEMRIVRLDPYPFHKDLLAPIPESLLLDEVLERLVFPAPENQGSSVATIVDASRAMPADDDAWSVLFQRMNERRNAIMLAVPGPLLIVGPRRYAALVGRAAPDLWSIVGALVDVPTPAMEEEWLAVFGEEEPDREADQVLTHIASGFVQTPAMNDVAKAERALAEAREVWARLPENDWAATFVAAQLLQLGALRARQKDSNATRLLDEGLQILQRFANHADEPIIIKFSWSAFLFRGVANLIRKDFVRARDDLVESTRGIRRTLQLEPESSAANIVLASNLFALGILHRAMGNVDEAIVKFSECIAHYRKFALTGEDASMVALSASYAHDELGHISRTKHDLDAAWAQYDESAKLSFRIWQGNLGDGNALGSFATTRLNMSKLQWLRGDVDRARGLALQALGTIDAFTGVAESVPNLVELGEKIRTYLAQLNAGTN